MSINELAFNFVSLKAMLNLNGMSHYVDFIGVVMNIQAKTSV